MGFPNVYNADRCSYIERPLMKILCLVTAVCIMASSAYGAVVERLTLYRGDEIESAEGITFDGAAFSMPGQPPLKRNEVQTIEFRDLEQGREAQGETAAGEGLTPLAQAQLERGRRMAEEYPGVPGVILVDDGVFVYREDGTNAYQYHYAGLVLKEEMKSWAQITVGFTEGRSRARILFARSVNPDGSVTALPPEGFKVGSPSEALQFFNPNRKVLSGVIPGVEVGSIVEYAYEYEYYNPEDPRLFSPGYFFQGEEPVVFSRVKVEAPKDVTLNYMTRNFSEALQEEPDIEDTGESLVYTWQVEEMPPVTPEPYMPPMADVVPMMDASIFQSHEDVFELLRGLQEARIRVTPDIKAAVEEIVAGVESVDEKIARIYHWVQENTRYISIKGSLGAGFSGHTAQETFENRYGDCTDKAVLFATMLEAIGVDSYPVIVRTNDSGVATTEIPTLSGNHCISEVCLPDRSFYLDATAQNYRYPYLRMDDHGVYALNAIRGHINKIPVPPPSENRRYSRLEVVIEPNGDAKVRTRNEYNGNIEAGVRGFWKRTREDNRKLMMAQYVNSISPGATLDDFTLSDLNDLAKPLTMTIDYTLAQHAIRAKDLMYFRVPTLERDYGEVSLETRRYPIQYMTTTERILEIDLRLPEGFRPEWFPPRLDIATPYLEFSAGYEERGGHIFFREVFRCLQRIVPPEDYTEHRDSLRAIAAFSKKEVFLTDKDE